MGPVVRIFFGLATIGALFGGVAAVADGASAQRLTVAADVWCPYNCEPGSDRPGYLVDILHEVFAPLGVSVEYSVLPWKRALVSAEKGLIDAVLGAVSGNRGRNIIGREALGVDETVLVVRAGEVFDYRAPDSLDALTVGVIAEYTYDGHGPLDVYLEQRIQGGRNVSVIHQEQPLRSLLKMLHRSRIDVFPENRYVAQYEIERLGYSGLVALVPTGAADSVYIAFTPGPEGRKNVERLDAGVRRLRESGKLSRILERYGLTYAP
jgi:polar amino acid transport system substrate-binding protein